MPKTEKRYLIPAPSQAGGSVITAMDYLGGFQYQDNVLKHFPTAEGYVSHVSGSYQYVYNYTDHLGNIRLSYGWDTAEAKLKIMEENHYYPFGMKRANYNTHTLSAMKKEESNEMTLKAMAAPSNPKPVMGYNYKYNGKELQDELGLNMTAMDFRQYDNAIGRFVGMERLSEFTYGISPYRFGFNNPVVFSDPSGLFEENKQSLERCPTCPNTPEFKPLIDDPKNDYVYDPETKTATQFIQLEEVVIESKPNKSASDYYSSLEFNYNGINDILVGGGLSQFQKGYNNNYAFFNRQYYNFYKATKSKLNLPKPGQQRQILKRLLSTSKFSKTSKFIKGAGALGAGLTVLNIAADGSDGSLKASSIIDGSMLAGAAIASAVFPPAAPFIAAGMLIYGIADYTFEINDTIDNNTNEVKIFD